MPVVLRFYQSRPLLNPDRLTGKQYNHAKIGITLSVGFISLSYTVLTSSDGHSAIAKVLFCLSGTHTKI